MNNKISFIACINNEVQEIKCRNCIKSLNVPDGFELEFISIWGAKSITNGYNQAMSKSDAKYKVYLHQDVHIIYEDFLFRMLDVFQDASVGMLGLVGSPKLPEDAIMWHGEKCGSVEYNAWGPYANIREQNKIPKKPYEEVEALDGLLLATQMDIPWREDLFDGWHFYDISQSREMIQVGYKVVVPYMETAWAVHDCGIPDMGEYEKYRNRFIKEYDN